MGKGQAALEFLMNYGWAILVVLIVIGALSYFGVLSPDRFIEDKCFCSDVYMSYSAGFIEDNILYLECCEAEYSLNEERTRIERQITYSIFYCAENKTLIPVR